jgi:hypothetical protein
MSGRGVFRTRTSLIDMYMLQTLLGGLLAQSLYEYEPSVGFGSADAAVCIGWLVRSIDRVVLCWMGRLQTECKIPMDVGVECASQVTEALHEDVLEAARWRQERGVPNRPTVLRDTVAQCTRVFDNHAK